MLFALQEYIFESRYRAGMNGRIQRQGPNSGATVIEMVVVISILVLFAGLVIPEVKNYFAEAKAAKMASVYQMVANGAIRLWSDTGEYGIENSSDAAQSAHQLFYAQSAISGWSGAYIDHPLTPADNPYSLSVDLKNKLDVVFDLDGDGSNEVDADPPKKGNYLKFKFSGDLQDPILKKLDDMIDGKAGVTGENWHKIGRVKIEGDSIYMFIFTMEK